MSLSSLSRHVLVVAVAATLSGCASGNMGGSPPEAALRSPQTSHRASWISAPATNQNLLYVSDVGAETVDVFSFPDGALVGTLTGFSEPHGLCSDPNGDVFVADTNGLEILEYAHGGTQPISTLADTSSPVSCAVDPKTGNLAVANSAFPLLASGSIWVYKQAKGTPTVYKSNSAYNPYFCGYDDSGNLYVDGFNTNGQFQLSTLSSGSSSLTPISLSYEVGWPGAVQWDGRYLAVGDQIANKFVSERYRNVIYQLSITNNAAKVIKTIPIKGGEEVVQFWIAGKTVVGPDAIKEDVGFWRYPEGGRARSALTKFYEPVGTTVSRNR